MKKIFLGLFVLMFLTFAYSCNKGESFLITNEINENETNYSNEQINNLEAGWIKKVLQWVGIIPKVDVFVQHGFYEDNKYGYQCNQGDAICMVHVVVENYEPEEDETKAELMRIYDSDTEEEFLAAVIKKDNLSDYLKQNVYNDLELYMPYDLSLSLEINSRLGFQNNFIIKKGGYLINTEYDAQGNEYYTIVFK